MSAASEHNARILTNIRQYCVVKHTSIPKIEKALGFGNGSISGWAKAKKKAPQDRVEAIAQLLGVTVGDLLSENEKKPAEAGQREELIRLFEAASPELQAAALAVLRSAEGSPNIPGDDPTNK